MILLAILLLIIIIYKNRSLLQEGKKGKKGKKGKCSIKSIRKKCKKQKGKKKKKCIHKQKNKCKQNSSKNIYNTACGATEPVSDAGTVFWKTDMYIDADKTAFVGYTYAELNRRNMFDRRTNSFNNQNAHIFNVTFGTNTQKVIEARVNSDDFNKQDAIVQVTKYCTFVGRLPGFLVSGLKIINIQGGDDLWGGNAMLRSLEITAGNQGDAYIRDSDIYNVIAHELTHAVMDLKHLGSSGWIAAMNLDCMAISSYAREFPGGEDLAETLGP